MKPCKICGEKTESVFNINFKAIPICESCAVSIFLQQAVWYAHEKEKTKKEESKKEKLCQCDRATGLVERGKGKMKYVCKKCKRPISS